MALVKKPTKAPASMMDLAFYSAGGGIPEGKYALEFDVKMHQATDKQSGANRGPERLGVMITAHPLPLGSGEAIQKFLSMGRKAHLSWAPDPDSGKDVVQLPNGAGASLPSSTNWGYFLKSLLDCGMPQGLANVGEADGVHVVISNVPEPEERKGFAQNDTSEAGEEGPVKGSGTIPVVTEILEDGKPWEGTGGLPDAAPVKAAAKKAAPVAAKPVARAKPAPVEEEAAGGGDDEEMAAMAITHLATLLGANPKPTKMLARTTVFKAIKDKTVANAVVNRFFDDDDTLNELVGQLGYQVAGSFLVAQ